MVYVVETVDVPVAFVGGKANVHVIMVVVIHLHVIHIVIKKGSLTRLRWDLIWKETIFNQVVSATPRRNAVVRRKQNRNQNQILFAIVLKDAKLAGIECARLTDIVVEGAFVVIGLRRSTFVSHNVPGSFNN